MTTDIKRLEETIERLRTRGSYGRRFGKTFYACQQIVGYLEALTRYTDITVVIENYGRLDNLLQTLSDIVYERGYAMFKKRGTEIRFPEFNMAVHFVSLKSGESQLRGVNAKKPYIIFDLEEVGPSFFNGDVFKGHVDITLQYLKEDRRFAYPGYNNRQKEIEYLLDPPYTKTVKKELIRKAYGG